MKHNRDRDQPLRSKEFRFRLIDPAFVLESLGKSYFYDRNEIFGEKVDPD